MHRSFGTVIAVLVAVLVAVTGCGGHDDAERAGAETPSADVVPFGEPIEVEVEGADWTFVVTPATTPVLGQASLATTT